LSVQVGQQSTQISKPYSSRGSRLLLALNPPEVVLKGAIESVFERKSQSRSCGLPGRCAPLKRALRGCSARGAYRRGSGRLRGLICPRGSAAGRVLSAGAVRNDDEQAQREVEPCCSCFVLSMTQHWTLHTPSASILVIYSRCLPSLAAASRMVSTARSSPRPAFTIRWKRWRSGHSTS